MRHIGETLIKGNLSKLTELEDSNNVSVIVEYKSRIKEFRKPPAKVQVTLPSFFPKPINGEHFYEFLWSIKPLVLTTDEDDYKIKLPKFSPRELLIIPEVIKSFNTGYEYIRSICFYIGVGIWIYKCFNWRYKMLQYWWQIHANNQNKIRRHTKWYICHKSWKSGVLWQQRKYFE